MDETERLLGVRDAIADYLSTIFPPVPVPVSFQVSSGETYVELFPVLDNVEYEIRIKVKTPNVMTPERARARLLRHLMARR